jgi:hypothetical protein
MNPDERDPFDKHLGKIARDFKYPPTPRLAANVRARLEGRSRPRARWNRKLSVAIVLFILLALFAVPAVRAGLADFFQVGVVRIFPVLSGATPTRTPGAVIPGATPTAYPSPTRVPVSSLLTLVGRTTLEEAQKAADFTILLPAYPADLGEPDLVYYQSRAKMAILVWLDPADPQEVILSLHEVSPGSTIIKKMEPEVIQETTVNGQYALWTTGPYLVQTTSQEYDVLRLVDGHTLVWTVGSITYRLETGLPLAEAVRIAESMH